MCASITAYKAFQGRVWWCFLGLQLGVGMGALEREAGASVQSYLWRGLIMRTNTSSHLDTALMSRFYLYQGCTSVKTCILTQDQKQIVKIRLKRIGEKRGPTITCLQWGHRVFSAEWYVARERADHRLWPPSCAGHNVLLKLKQRLVPGDRGESEAAVHGKAGFESEHLVCWKSFVQVKR